MFAAFTYWELRINRSWPAPLALFLVLLVLAPLMGVVIERVVMRSSASASTITKIVVTIGLLATFIGIGNMLWPAGSATRPYTLPAFFATPGWCTSAASPSRGTAWWCWHAAGLSSRSGCGCC